MIGQELDMEHLSLHETSEGLQWRLCNPFRHKIGITLNQLSYSNKSRRLPLRPYYYIPETMKSLCDIFSDTDMNELSSVVDREIDLANKSMITRKCYETMYSI